MTSAAMSPMVARVQNRRGEGDRLRTELLDAAAELLAEKGDVDAVSLRAIAARAGVSPTAVYRHFDDHESLLRGAVEYCWAEFEDALAGSVVGSDDPFTRVRECGRAYIRFAFEQPGKYHVLFSNKVDVGRDHQSPGESAFDFLVALIRDVLVARADDRDPHFVAVQVHTWIHGIVDLGCKHDSFDWPPAEVLLAELADRLGIADPSGAG